MFAVGGCSDDSSGAVPEGANPMYKCILIPTDGSEFCERAIRHGVSLAKQLQARVVGLTVTQPLHTGTPRALLPDDIAGRIHAETVKFASENLTIIEQTAKAADVTVETVHESHDHPWEAILQIAKTKGCDLIAMASHGRRGVSAMILGSETQKVVTHSTIPVLVVR
jgi:nucleotide-binding universal stress UspA family protein